MTEVEELAQIIIDNPGAVAYIDNDNWQLNKLEPPKFEDWEDEKQEEWYENCEIVASRDFSTLEVPYGYGLLEAMALILKIKIRSV